ncbi:MAG TPA: alpha/beta family hydrolase [Actinomycetota bacterium]|nr:alpha/beta family hydrolase [Actinomycetota bacterium]
MEKLATPNGEVSLAVDEAGAPRAALVLGHGAGSGMESPFMAEFASGLAQRGVTTYRFNFLYTEQGRKAPDRQPILEATFAAVAEAVAEREPRPVFLGGKSLGGRIASHVVASGGNAAGLAFLGYPLHPPGRPDRIRDAHLIEISVPMLFVEGTRDPFCPLDTLEKVRGRLKARSEVAVIEDGDHSLKVRKSSGRDSGAAWAEAMDAVAAWIVRESG